MSLLPDEIARRSFTPSADGYHQGEVRAFLERMAHEQRALLASMPEGQRLVVDLTMAVAAQETRLAKLEQRLENTVAQLVEVAATVQQTQDRAMQQLAAASRVAGEQQQLLIDLTTAVADTKSAAKAIDLTSTPPASPPASPPPASPPPTPPPSSTTPSATETSTSAPKTATTNPTAAATAAPSTPAPGEPAAATPPAPMTPTQPVHHPLPGSRDARISARTTSTPPTTAHPGQQTPAPAPAESNPTPQAAGRGGDSIPEGVIGVRLMRSTPATSSPARATEPIPDDAPAALLAAIDDQEPLITDNVNDLLDDVLDDVMENITERPTTT